MRNHLISSLIMALSITGCASIKGLSFKPSNEASQSFVSPEIVGHGEYISAAIADWIFEEANTNHIRNISFASSNTPNDNFNIHNSIADRLKSKGLNIVQSEENNTLKIWYWAGEVDDKILIRITANNKEATRLFTKAANNTIIPASPLTIRLNQ